MEVPLFFVVFCILAGIGTLHLVGVFGGQTQPGAAARPSTWAVVLRTPALLVPATIAAVGAWLWADFGEPTGFLSENPFGVRSFGVSPYGVSPLGFPASPPSLQNTILMVIMAALVAGYVGLLRPLHAQQKPTSLHFVQGIKDHTLTFVIAKILTGLFVTVVAGLIPPGEFLAILYIAPSLLLAPLAGTAAQHPRRPLRALHAAVSRVGFDLSGTASILVVQILVLVPVFMLFAGSGVQGLRLIDVLAREASALSFNPFPLLARGSHGVREPWLLVGLVFLAGWTSSAFLMQYYRRVMDHPAPAAESR